VEHLLLEFFPRAALVWSLVQHKLMANDSKRIVVGLVAVILLEDDLRGHVTGGA